MKCVYKHHCLKLWVNERLFLVSDTLLTVQQGFFPKSVHILGMPVLYQLTCMVYDDGGPWLRCRCILGRWKLLVLNCCSCHLWFYDRGRLERVEISTFRVGIQILTLLSKKVFWNWSSWEWRLYYLLSKSKWFLHWHQDKICLQFQTGVGRPTWFLLHAKMLLAPICFFCGW